MSLRERIAEKLGLRPDPAIDEAVTEFLAESPTTRAANVFNKSASLETTIAINTDGSRVVDVVEIHLKDGKVVQKGDKLTITSRD